MRLIIASNKTAREIPFETKRVKYTAIWKKSIKIVKESKKSFLPRFPPQFFYSLLHNFIIFAPQSRIPSSKILIFSLNFFLFPPPQFWYFLSILLFSLLLLLLFISIVFPPPPPPHFYCFPSSSSSSFLFSLLLHLLIFIVFPRKGQKAKIRLSHLSLAI